MAIKNIIARGIGFTPGSISFIPTLGFTPGPAVVEVFGKLCADFRVFAASGASLATESGSGGGISVSSASGATVTAQVCEE